MKTSKIMFLVLALALPLFCMFFACGSFRPATQVNPYYYSSYPPNSRSHVYIGGFTVYLKKGVGNENVTQAQKDEYTRLIAEYTAAIAANPADAASYNERGVVYNKLNKLDESFADFNNAIRADPALTDAYYNRGIVSLQRNESGAALADLQKVIAVYPANKDVQYYLGVCYYEVGDKKNAHKLFETVNENDPHYLDVAQYLASYTAGTY
ncbi:MAG: tetratricopeptide repeat protein [Spirochaetaceae bacterium]|jgi:tetratricopeptide (TPR) repeat protein|nr:tetratricopeptide repeat protein [Spirochaetaceae bacterium]